MHAVIPGRFHMSPQVSPLAKRNHIAYRREGWQFKNESVSDKDGAARLGRDSYLGCGGGIECVSNLWEEGIEVDLDKVVDKRITVGCGCAHTVASFFFFNCTLQ